MNSPRFRPLANRFGRQIEGLLLVAFIGILAAIAIPQFEKYRERATEAGEAPESWDLVFIFFGSILALGVALFLLGVLGSVLAYVFRRALLHVRSLSPDQESTLDEYAIKWRDIMNSTQQADRPRAEEAARRVYETAGLDPPEHYIWLNSPLQGKVCVSMIPANAKEEFGSPAGWDVLYKLRTNIRDKLVFRVEDSVMKLAREKLELHDRVFFLVDNCLDDLIDEGGYDDYDDDYFDDDEDGGAMLERPAKDAIWENAMDEVIERLSSEHGIVVDKKAAHKNAVPDWMDNSRLAKPSNEANEIGLYEFFANEFSLDYAAKLEPVIELTKNCGWWWPFKNAVILTERPCLIKRDNEGRIGATGGPAIEYLDGWKIFAVGGVIFPQEWAETPEPEWEPIWLLDTPNSEHRRVILEVCGYARVMADFDSELVDQNGDMELRRIMDADVEPIMLLKVADHSTGAPYLLRVPPEMTDCETARQWTFGDEDIDLVKET